MTTTLTEHLLSRKEISTESLLASPHISEDERERRVNLVQRIKQAMERYWADPKQASQKHLPLADPYMVQMFREFAQGYMTEGAFEQHI
mmetsp:Transcript_36588/g.44677  ORF Transcript_36588/g.44677 Transcript_36588/m.44677 type:complete len:89 (+) Transcript_36588:2388-2654(+)